ncbi:phospholipase D Z-like [Lolium rigidum]|uniref:phospholipase D Z-like n=1 Tax=Lolium rigidum TaxID=89674 RepID=UPI001F5D619B|nr:phospholipase D Z-like [Lolium rigidum]
MAPLTRRRLLVVVVLLSVLAVAALPAAAAATSCRAWLVQSIPTDMPHLRRVPGVLSTADVLQWLSGNATKNLDILAQYWQLLAQPKNPKSGDYGFSESDMARFGAEQGLQVYKALENAADRKVKIRIVQHSGFAPEFDQESADLAAGRPNVQNATLLFEDWWGSGVLHAKVWISDKKDLYIGSANNDWKSLTQVKELGIYFTSCPQIAKTVEVYFQNLWTLSTLNSTTYTKVALDKQWQTSRKVPCWSHFLQPKDRCRSPLPLSVDVPYVDGYPSLANPKLLDVLIETPGLKSSNKEHYFSYLSFAPPELSFDKFQADEQGWVDTIKSVNSGGMVRINTMDWLGQSQYAPQTVFWPSLSSAISEVIISKNATVRILVAYWTHFIPNTENYLKSLLYSNILCASSKYNHCGGKVEIRYYVVPGYNSTGPALSQGAATGNLYPDFTRVNHGKYAVSDTRANIGTSNLIWDYFYTTAGVSFGTYNPSIVSQLQDVFDADWDSPYTVPVKPLQASV